MKIAIIIWKLDISGGGQRQALELAYNLQKKSHQVDVFCCYLNKEKCYPNIINKLNVYVISSEDLERTLKKKLSFSKKIISKIKNYSLDAENILLVNLIQKRNKTVKYDVFNYHDSKVFMIAPFFEKEKNFWMMNDLPSILDIKQRNNLFRKTGHGIKSIFKKIVLVNKFINTEINLNLYVRYIGKVMVLDERNKNLAKRYFFKNSTVIRSGIDIEKFKVSKKQYNLDNKINLLSTSIFFPHRRYEDTIEALNILINNHKITNLHFNIVGESKTDPEYYSYIQSLVQKYSLKKDISFLGSVSDEKLAQLYKNSDIFIFPNTNQTWGLAVFEAMLSGCVAIVSNGCGAHEVLTNKQNAIIVKEKSSNEIAIAIKHLITNKKEMEKIGENGQSFVKDNLSWDKYTDEMLKIFRS